MKKATKLWIAFLMMALTMGLTWVFSSSTGKASNEFSNQIVDAIMNAVARVITIREADLFWQDNLNWLLRKFAHMSVYFLLGLFSLTFFDIWLERFRFAVPAALLFCLLWASVDEYRQRYVDGRTGQAFDVAVDMVGAMLGLLIALLFLYVLHKISRLKAQLKEAEAQCKNLRNP